MSTLHHDSGCPRDTANAAKRKRPTFAITRNQRLDGSDGRNGHDGLVDEPTAKRSHTLPDYPADATTASAADQPADPSGYEDQFPPEIQYRIMKWLAEIAPLAALQLAASSRTQTALLDDVSAIHDPRGANALVRPWLVYDEENVPSATQLMRGQLVLEKRERWAGGAAASAYAHLLESLVLSLFRSDVSAKRRGLEWNDGVAKKVVERLRSVMHSPLDRARALYRWLVCADHGSCVVSDLFREVSALPTDGRYSPVHERLLRRQLDCHGVVLGDGTMPLPGEPTPIALRDFEGDCDSIHALGMVLAIRGEPLGIWAHNPARAKHFKKVMHDPAKARAMERWLDERTGWFVCGSTGLTRDSRVALAHFTTAFDTTFYLVPDHGSVVIALAIRPRCGWLV